MHIRSNGYADERRHLRSDECSSVLSLCFGSFTAASGLDSILFFLMGCNIDLAHIAGLVPDHKRGRTKPTRLLYRPSRSTNISRLKPEGRDGERVAARFQELISGSAFIKHFQSLCAAALLSHHKCRPLCFL